VTQSVAAFGWFVLIESILAVLAALRVFFSRRGDAALEVLASASRSPCSNANVRGPF
jgi:hypothetical protein